MKRAPTSLTRTSNQRGFTLVELMVAMVLALLLLAAIGAIYVSSKQTFRVQDNTSGIDEVLRAIETDMSSEIRKAGYFGCFRWKDGVTGPAYALTAKKPLSKLGKFPIPMDSGAPKLGPAYDVRGGTADTTSINPNPQSGVTILPGTEYLSISYGQPQAYLKTAMKTGVEPLELNRAITVKDGQPLLLANCDAMTLMRADQSGTLSTIAHDPNAGDNDSLGDPKWAYTLFAQGATLMSLQSSVFFLAQKAGDPPTLYLLTPNDSTNPAQPLASNVEQLNFLYGVDSGAGLSFKTAAAVAADEWPVVRAVKVGVVVRSNDANVSGTAAGAGVKYTWNSAAGRYDMTNTASDNYLRKAHVFTVAIRGRSPAI